MTPDRRLDKIKSDLMEQIFSLSDEQRDAVLDFLLAREDDLLYRIGRPLKKVKCANGSDGGSSYELLCQAIEKALCIIDEAKGGGK